MYQAHNTAIIAEGAQIGAGTSIGPYSIIGPKVKLGSNNKIGPHVVLEGNTTIGDDNTIYQFASIGSAPQDQKWQGEDTVLTIGNGNQIREYVTIQPATNLDGITKVGDNNLFMASSHIAHDVIVGNNCWFANSACAAGHVVIGNGVIVGGFAGIHQFVNIGDLAFIGAGSMVAKDIPNFCIAQGDRAKLVQINKLGLQRHGYSDSEIRKLQTVFRKLFYEDGSLQTKLERIEQEYGDLLPAQQVCSFVKASTRGIAAVNKHVSSEA
jgi:UDP-N-acetylglucosamine acyltransferase